MMLLFCLPRWWNYFVYCQKSNFSVDRERLRERYLGCWTRMVWKITMQCNCILYPLPLPSLYTLLLTHIQMDPIFKCFTWIRHKTMVEEFRGGRHNSHWPYHCHSLLGLLLHLAPRSSPLGEENMQSIFGCWVNKFWTPNKITFHSNNYQLQFGREGAEAVKPFRRTICILRL